VEPESLTFLADAPLAMLEQAQGGLLFLNEIGKINRQEQKGLLLLLGKLEKYNVRLVCATSLPLSDLTAQGEYDPRLYEILNSLCINVPSLKTHRENIPELASQMLSSSIESGEAPLRQFSTAALNALRNYDWPGNLSQLTGVVRSLALTGTNDEISVDDVMQALSSSMSTQKVSSVPLNIPLKEARDLFEKQYFDRLIEQESGNMTRVAERSGLERTHLYRKLKLLGVKLRNQ
jgi:DNA-binding NtrC family response regulator